MKLTRVLKVHARIEKFHLISNRRVQLFNDLESGAYASRLLQIGEGRLDTDDDRKISFINDLSHVVGSEDLIANVFPNLQQNIDNEEWLCERTILALTNDSVAKINKKYLGKKIGRAHV